MAFQKLLFASYEVPTFFRSGIPGEKDVPSLLTQAILRQAGPARRHSLPVDMWHRAEHLGRVLEATRASAGPLDPDTLPVFVAPEFFFRHPDRPYTEQEFFELLEALKALSLQAAPWLLVPGTCWWGHPGVPPCSAHGPWPVAPLLYNTVLALWRGELLHAYINPCPPYSGGLQLEGPGPALRRSARGAVVLDAMPPNHRLAPPPQEGHCDSAWLDTSLEPEFQGLSFGFETGTGHLAGKLLQSCTRQQRLADVHFLLACGLSVNPLHVATRSGGYVLHCDGRLWEAGVTQMPPLQQALFIHRGGGPSAPVDVTLPVPLLRRIEEPADAIGEDLEERCRERGFTCPAVVLYSPVSLISEQETA